MLNFTNVTKQFRLDENTTITPVRNANLQIASGEFIVIVGRSGTGKTTLLNLAAGLVKPTSGQVSFEEHELSAMNDRELSYLRGQKMGFVFQFPSLLPNLSVKENVSLPAIFANGNRPANPGKRTEELLGLLGLSGRLDVHPRQLSAGEQKRTVIARALLNQPKLVLADEPTSDLDNRTEKEVMRILHDVNSQGVTFLIVTHSLGLIDFAHRAFEMENGNLIQVK